MHTSSSCSEPLWRCSAHCGSADNFYYYSTIPQRIIESPQYHTPEGWAGISPQKRKIRWEMKADSIDSIVGFRTHSRSCSGRQRGRSGLQTAGMTFRSGQLNIRTKYRSRRTEGSRDDVLGQAAQVLCSVGMWPDKRRQWDSWEIGFRKRQKEQAQIRLLSGNIRQNSGMGTSCQGCSVWIDGFGDCGSRVPG